MKIYEAMFLLDPTLGADWTAAEAEVKRILDRAEAKVLGLKKWDERKLAYTIKRNKRGVYVLVFFEATADKIGPLERDVHLSEKILRVLVLRRENLTHEEIQKALTAAPPPKTPSRGDEWGPPSDSRGRSGGDFREPVPVGALDDIDAVGEE